MRTAALIAVVLAATTAAAQDRGMTEDRPSVREAASAPLRDLNLEQLQIPDALKRALRNPYDTRGMGSCEAIAGEVGRLDEALGRDVDDAAPRDRRSRWRRLGSAAGTAGLGVVREKARSVLRFRGWVRALSGADRHDKAAAVRAGGGRRGYLKGGGMRMNCAPPAAPRGFVPAHRRGGGLLAWFAGLWARIVAWVRGLFG